ncbi:MAG TPA: asparagine synthase (glutamine-hydrolyzing) [Blastocatellia bacterium]|nr:asparagine synthase (glutamine-hydrolyzing) [Blastocatellia bacterium]
MCGIAGLVGNRDRDTAVTSVGVMMRSLERRGPDGEGIETWSDAVLGHRRLAIIDLSEAGRQPMLSADKSIGISFNGEVYNFIELRKELSALGYRFISGSDTEVLIHGYEEWGVDDLLSKLRGMFAFALWDDRRRKLFLVRDRLGVKPLHYVVRDGCLAFASTVRALRAAGYVDEMDEQAVAEYLEFGFVTDARSIYRGAIKVRAASLVEWSDGTLRTREYWSPPEVNRNSRLTFDEAVEETERIFLEAVAIRLRSDVPVGALLSGGVDSSLVCWAVARLGAEVAAYTVGMPGDRLDESDDARATAAKLKISHRVLPFSAAESPDVSELVSAYGEPFACASALGMLGVSRAVRASAKVLLTGDGGDDVFLGYPEHRHFLMAQKLASALPECAGRLWQGCRDLLPRVGPLGRAATFIDFATGGLGGVATVHDGLPLYRRTGMLGQRLRDVNIEQRSIAWSTRSARDLLTEFLRYDRGMRFVGEYLTKVDGATMHQSLEARSPFLDHKLWEFASSLPFDLRLRGGRLKAILRELARRRIGEEVARGRKRGFYIPVQRWLVGRWRDRVMESFRYSLLEKEGWINSRAAVTQLEEASRRGVAPKQLWYLFVLESWLRRERCEEFDRRTSTPEIRVAAGNRATREPATQLAGLEAMQ